MTILPLMHRLKKKIHRDVALAQDIMVIEIYNHFPGVVIHGGTAIWRCYGGGRFSEDVDVYLPKRFRKSENMKRFLDSLRSRGFEVKKFREREHSLFSVFSYLNTTISFEAVFENVNNSVTRSFEMADGTFITVRTLEAEDLIKEKIAAYAKRRKIRDMHDIFYLMQLVENKAKLKPFLKKFLEHFEEPVDAANLKAIIISGAVPGVKDMKEAIKRWAK